jgi:outer membrane immunogenic protein
MSSKSARRGAYAAQLALLSLPVSALVAGAPALAQPANVNWTGMYAGFYAGGVWGRGNSTANSDCPTAAAGGVAPAGYYCDATIPASSANASAVTSAGSGSASSSKFTGGIQIGHNWQTGNFVYGVEGDFGAFNIRSSRSGSGVYPAGAIVTGAGTAFTVTNSFSTDWLLTVRGRLGWAASGWLVYATGGLAMSRVEVENSFSDNNVVGGFGGATESASASKIKVGWTLGGGLEYALTRNWSIKGEYIYVDLGSVSALGTVTHPFAGFVGYTNALGVSTSLTAHVARLGANYRF